MTLGSKYTDSSLNTRSEVTKHRNHIKPVFEDAHKGRVWIVVGYSGDLVQRPTTSLPMPEQLNLL
jgi:hypothetical protein